MSPRVILTWPDPRLSQTCAPVTRIDDATRRLVAEMFETMYAAPGRGLAAPQVGEMIRIFVIDTGWKEGRPEPIAFLNPEIVALSDEHVRGEESCLSLPGVPVQVGRAADATLRWTTLDGHPDERRFTGFAAACVQHELDHLDGVLILDRIDVGARAALAPALAALGGKA